VREGKGEDFVANSTLTAGKLKTKCFVIYSEPMANFGACPLAKVFLKVSSVFAMKKQRTEDPVTGKPHTGFRGRGKVTTVTFPLLTAIFNPFAFATRAGN
jgi:hypothetical protein